MGVLVEPRKYKLVWSATIIIRADHFGIFNGLESIVCVVASMSGNVYRIDTSQERENSS